MGAVPLNVKQYSFVDELHEQDVKIYKLKKANSKLRKQVKELKRQIRDLNTRLEAFLK